MLTEVHLVYALLKLKNLSDYGSSHHENPMNYILIILLFIYLLWLLFILLLFWEYEKMKKPREIILYERNVQSNNCIAYFGKLARRTRCILDHEP